MNKVESAELKSDIDDLQKLIDTISNKQGATVVETTHSFTGKGEIFSKEMERGSYLLEVSGLFVCAAGVTNKHDLVFTIKTAEQTFNLQTCLHTNGGYGYPYSLRKDFILTNKSLVTLSVNHNQNQTYSLQNNIVSLSPMFRAK